MHVTDRERARAEAADWCVRLNGGADHPANAEFQRWLAESSLNRQLFSEMSELHRFGAALRSGGSEAAGDTLPQGPKRRSRLLQAGLVALLVGGLTVAGAAAIIATSRQMPEVFQSRNDGGPVSLAAASEKRSFHLSDGSTVVLDAASRVTVSIDGGIRRLRLENGRARFEVAHDGRPFIVEAGNGSVRALGTIFDVTILNDKSVHVDLLRGAVAVRSSHRTATSSTDEVRRLAAGESAEFDALGAMQRSVGPERATARHWPEGLVTYNGAGLEEVLEQANRYGKAGFKLKVTDAAIARRPVYGALKVDDPRRLAPVLARSLDLEVVETETGLTLSRK